MLFTLDFLISLVCSRLGQFGLGPKEGSGFMADGEESSDTVKFGSGIVKGWGM